MNIPTDAYSHKDTWTRRGESFGVEIVHWESYESYETGKHRWNVYGIVGEKHPIFKVLKAHDGYTFTAPLAFDMHGGITFFDVQEKLVKFGDDYNHHYDEYYTHQALPEHVREVFDEADALFQFLEQKSKEAQP